MRYTRIVYKVLSLVVQGLPHITKRTLIRPISCVGHVCAFCGYIHRKSFVLNSRLTLFHRVFASGCWVKQTIVNNLSLSPEESGVMFEKDTCLITKSVGSSLPGVF